ncbi:MAG: cell surface protein SprA [Bacteroidales bacterium]|nr:cell surface protein SprA [Bacteroidales bacterium]
MRQHFRTFFAKTYKDSPDSIERLKDKYLYTELYSQTKTNAKQVAEKNKFLLKGTYKSSVGSEIQLNAMNIPKGSVKVTAGGNILTEGADYTVDYTLGRVQIINQGLLESGTPLRISLESNSLFSIQTKTMVGTHLNYKFSDDFYLGGTILNLTERPLTNKVNFGDEPISNTIWGLNGSYRTEAPFLTKLVDKLPFIETKEKSTIAIDAEFAQLKPGSPKAIGKQGVAYIDDFEASEVGLDQKYYTAWYLASTPPTIKGGDRFNDLAYNYNRAKISWFTIDPLFLRDNSLTPDHLSKDDKSTHWVREILEKEVFPNREAENNRENILTTLNIAYYPREKGPYNYDAEGEPGYSAGIDNQGYLKDPESRWGGIMRELVTTDFEESNIEYIEVWVMDPYAEYRRKNNREFDEGDPNPAINPIPDDLLGEDPALYFNLGNISEDILKDGRKSAENAITPDGSKTAMDSTVWGWVPQQLGFQDYFDEANAEQRIYQDIGLDALDDKEELQKYAGYVAQLDELVTDDARKEELKADVANDNFHYFRGTDYDNERKSILDRYKNYNGLEGNSATQESSKESYSTTGDRRPDIEDINQDKTLSGSESYFEYKISLKPSQLQEVGSNYIKDIRGAEGNFTGGNNQKYSVGWYQFRIPLREIQEFYGGIEDFRSIRLCACT